MSRNFSHYAISGGKGSLQKVGFENVCQKIKFYPSIMQLMVLFVLIHFIAGIVICQQYFTDMYIVVILQLMASDM